MAATCEERGSKHVKDVFLKPTSAKSNSITFMARRPVAPLPPRQTSTGQSVTSQNSSAAPKPTSNGIANHTNATSKTNGDVNKKEIDKGEYFLRATKDKHIDAMELPVPAGAAPTRREPKLSDSSQTENIYESVSPLPSPASPQQTPTSPGPSPSYTTNISAEPSPGYSTNISAGARTSSSSSSGGISGINRSVKSYPAPAPPVAKSSRAPKVPGYSKALAGLQAPKSPAYSKQLNGNVTSQASPGYDTSLGAGYTRQNSTGSDSNRVHHVVQVHNTDTSPVKTVENTSPIYERKFDFPSPAAVDNSDVGSLFSGYDTQDSPYTPPSPPTNGPINPGITILDKTANNSSSLFKKNQTNDRQTRLTKRFSGDETNSSLVASSGYYSEYGSESEGGSTVIDRSKGHQNLNSSFDEDECTVDFIDDDDMYTNGQKYSVSRLYLSRYHLVRGHTSS